MGGMGFRSAADTCFPAYIGALEQAASFMSQVVGLQEVIGDDDNWSSSDNRWTKLLESGSKEGEEFKNAWTTLQEEGRQSAEWLEKELEGALAQDGSCVGEGSTSGAVRKSIVEERD